MPFDQSDDIAVLRSAEQVAFPVTRHRPVFYRSGSFPDRNRIRDLAALLRCMARATDGPPGPQMQQELLFQHAACLDEQTAIDRLVRHTQRLMLWAVTLQPPGDLLRRPIASEVPGHDAPQFWVPRELTRLRTPSSIPGSPIPGFGAGRTGATVARDLPAHRRRRPSETAGDPAQRAP